MRDADLCHWRDLRVTDARGRQVSESRARRVLVYWREHSQPPDGYNIAWPDGKTRCDMMGFDKEHA